MSGERRIEAAFLAACRAEIEAPKPGNVHRFAPGHGMTAETFEIAAAAAAPYLAAAGAPLGARVLESVRASVAAVGLNANLGILLLCAPLAMAAERDGPAPLRQRVRGVLAALDAGDAAAVFAAIALAAPGGLGEAGEHDVRRPPAVPLVEAMRLAAPRDLVARQYTDGFAAVFETGVAELSAPLPAGAPPWWPATRAFLAFAARFADSHIGRKFGPDAAEAVRTEMDALRRTIEARPAAEAIGPLMALDASLKARGLNPGTSADLTVAVLFAGYLEAPPAPPLRNAGADG